MKTGFGSEGDCSTPGARRAHGHAPADASSASVTTPNINESNPNGGRMEPLGLIALAAAYALADRAFGMDRPAWLGGKPLKGPALAVLALVGFLAAGVPGALMAGVWAIWRTPPWQLIPPGSATPRGMREIGATFLRHLLLSAPFAGLVGHWTGGRTESLVCVMAFFALGATIAAWGYAREIDRHGSEERARKFNAGLELARGAMFGALAAAGIGGA